LYESWKVYFPPVTLNSGDSHSAAPSVYAVVVIVAALDPASSPSVVEKVVVWVPQRT
jgi:hypothetical protein